MPDPPDVPDMKTVVDSGGGGGNAVDDPMIGKVVGRYTIRAAIGAGGMGTVYLARQENPRRDVAVKVVNPGVVSPKALRRFELETQTLGRLRHEHIAQIYEAGTYDDGSGARPFFAMEYLAGAKTITQFADDARLSTRQRLALFQKVCSAVQHGHTKGVIHRDLKPANVLVTSSGSPKIIDFGVARSTDSDMAVTTMQTDVGALIGTLAYMSPEQCAADPNDIDTRSDVYALGVMLFELLCGRMPYDVTKVAIHEAARIVQQDEPTRLSTVDRQLRGDLEIITLKALEKERTRRYQSATALEEDLGRYIEGEVISAKAPSVWDYMRRFARRHRAAAMAMVTVFLVLVVAVVAIAMFAVDATRQRASAQQQATRAEATKSFVIDMLAGVDPETAGRLDKELMKLILDEAAVRVSVEFTQYPLLEAELRYIIGSAQHALGMYVEGLEHLDASYALWRSHGDLHDQQYGKILYSLGLTQLKLGHLDDVQKCSSELLLFADTSAESSPNTRVSARGLQALLCTDLGRLEEAQAHWEDGLAIAREHLAPESDAVMTMVGSVGFILNKQGRTEEAAPYLEETLALRRSVLGDEHPDTLVSINNLALLRRAQERLQEANALMQEAVQVSEAVFGASHMRTAQYRYNLGMSFLVMGLLDEAEPHIVRAEADVRGALGADHPRVVKLRDRIARYYDELGHPDQAQRYRDSPVSE